MTSDKIPQSTAPSNPTHQTIRLNGRRLVLTTRNGKVTAKPALPEEWELQAAQVRALRAMPEYGKQFLLAGDQNAAKRGPKARAQAIAAGMTPGEADLRIYLLGGRVKHIENKVGKRGAAGGKLSPAQIKRHASLTAIGHEVVVVSALDCDDAARQVVDMVRGWCVANDVDATIA